MSGQRFEDALRDAVLADDPGPVPESLRRRVARVPGEAAGSSGPARRRATLLAFGRALAGIAAAALVVAILISVRGVGGGPAATPAATPAASGVIESATPSPSATGAASPAAAGVIPWVDRPASPPPTPSPSPQPVADARPCRPSDLRVATQPTGAAAGNIDLAVTFANVSATDCALVGFPASLAGRTPAGVWEAIAATHGSFFGDPGPAANIPPGGAVVAMLNVSWGDGCPAAQTGAQKLYRALRIGLPAGGTVEVAVGSATGAFAGGVDVVCGVGVSHFGVPSGQGPDANPMSPLTAQASLPASVAPGTTLRYTVAITNPTGSAYPLNPCPVYQEWVASGTTTTWDSTTYVGQLNCGPVGSIPAGGTVTFQMQLAVPTTQPPGTAKFSWSILGGEGPWAGGPLVVAPTP
jgi:hypothetical protein